jgi:hypothetical protein
MAAQGPVRRVLLYGIVVGALVLAASAAAAPVAFRSASAFAAAERLYGAPTASSEALFQFVREDQFCRLFPRDELCADHPLCNDDPPPSPS